MRHNTQPRHVQPHPSAQGLPRTIAAGALAVSMMLARLQHTDSATIARQRYSNKPALLNAILTQATKSGTVGDAEPGSLVSEGAGGALQQLTAAVQAEAVLPRVALHAPAHTPIAPSDGDAEAEQAVRTELDGTSIPVFGLSGISALMLLLKRMACIVGFTDEFLKRPGVESYVGTRLRRALVRGFNYVSLDPASAVSVLASTPEVVSGGADAESVLSDVETMLSYLSGTLSGAALFASPRTCAALALTRGTDGQLAFPGVTVKGGTLAGFSLLSALGLTDGILGVVDGNSVLFASEPVELARASSGTLEMSTTPASEIRTPTSMALSHAPVSLFQTDSSAIRATWPVAWAVRGAETVAAAYISGLPALPQPSA